MLVVVFLVAIQTVITLWSAVGGQSHLDLMAWYWKLGLLLAASGCVVALAAEVAKDSTNRSRIVMITGMLVVVMLIAGAVTYFVHLNEPADSGDEVDTPAMTTGLRLTKPQAAAL